MKSMKYLLLIVLLVQGAWAEPRCSKGGSTPCRTQKAMNSGSRRFSSSYYYGWGRSGLSGYAKKGAPLIAPGQSVPGYETKPGSAVLPAYTQSAKKSQSLPGY